MATDVRVRMTQKLIEDAFWEALEKTPMNRITVTGLCARCQINRATFYRHYLDVYDLLERIETDMLENLKSTLTVERLSDMEAYFEEILTNMAENGRQYRLLLGESGDPRFAFRLQECFLTEGGAFLQKNAPGLSQANRANLIHFLSFGSSGVMQGWFASGMVQPVKPLAAFLARACNELVTGMRRE